MKVFVLWIDALRHDYITAETMPFLHSLTQEWGFGFCEPMLGYNSIYATFITGKWPEENKQFVAFEPRRERLPFWFESSKFLPPEFFFRSLNLWRYTKGKDNFAPKVSWEVFKDFDLAQEYYYHHDNALPVKTLFNDFDSRGVSYLGYNWPLVLRSKGKSELTPFSNNSDQSRVRQFQHLLKESSSSRFYFLHLWDLDHAGHLLGIGSKELAPVLRRQDLYIENVLGEFNLEEDLIILWSDHGMLPVEKKLNIEAILPINTNKFNYFIDSTILRIYSSDASLLDEIKATFPEDYGWVVGDADIHYYHLEKECSRWGNLIFVANPGVIFLPNAFQRTDFLPKGMHGYGQKEKAEQGVYIINRALPDTLPLTAFASLIKKELSLE